MAKRYRLTTRAQMQGAIQEPGYEFTLDEEKGEKGPMRSVVASDHGANHTGATGELVDIPLYVEIEDEHEPEPVVEDEAFDRSPEAEDMQETVSEESDRPADPVAE